MFSVSAGILSAALFLAMVLNLAMKPKYSARLTTACMVVALIASTTLGILQNTIYAGGPIDPIGVALFLLAISVLRRYHPNPILLMLGCGLLGLLIYPFI